MFSEYEERFLKRNVQSALTWRTVNPFNWGKLMSGNYGRSELAAEYYDDQLGTRYFTGKLQVAENIIVDEVSSNAGVKDILDALVKNQLGRDPGVDAADYHRKRVLS